MYNNFPAYQYGSVQLWCNWNNWIYTQQGFGGLGGWGGPGPSMAGLISAATTVSYCRYCEIGMFTEVTGSAQCTACPAGKYNTGIGLSSCNACDVGTYSSAVGLSTCINCEAGKYATDNSNACTICIVGTISLVKSGTCTTCDPGSYSSGSGMSTCTNCIVGKYNSIAGLSTCTACAAGSYASADRSVRCTSCIANSTYASSTQSTACLACAVCDGYVRYQYSPCDVNKDAICCNNMIPIGTYASSCDGVAACPLLKNGIYMNSDTAKINRCPDFKCNVGYYSQPAEIAMATTMCAISNYALSSTCAPYFNKTCMPVTSCPRGVSTVLRTLIGVVILNTSSNDVQCTKCVSCKPGTFQISECTDSAQTVCAICSTTGLYAGFTWNDKCVLYSETPGPTTLTLPPTGYFPYTLTVSSAIVNAIADNSISYPTRKVTEFNFTSMATTALTSGFGFSYNVFIPCSPPPLGRRFKAWTKFQTKGAAIMCTSTTNCSNFQASCNLSLSTECIGWNDTLKKGWYATDAGECAPCPSTSTYSTCDWGFYRNLSDCMPSRQSGCFPCHGTLPLNAVWTTSKFPNHFDDSEANPCKWDCIKGYYMDGSECRACNKPANSEFDYGPYIVYGNTDPPAKTCLNASTCQYFGGAKGMGCAWNCPSGFSLDVNQYGDTSCKPCPVLSCQPDETIVVVDTCGECLKCDNIVMNAVYQPGCKFTCADGYYMLNPAYCALCSVKTCPAGQYSGSCGGASDSICIPCTTCSAGYGISTPCSASADAVCSACTSDLVPDSTYDASCNVVCNAGYVMYFGQCMLCAESDTSCGVGAKKAESCTAENLGCEACTGPQLYNWCWADMITACYWDCGPGYRKLNNSCVADASITGNVCLGPVFEDPLATKLSTTLPPVTLPEVTPPPFVTLPPLETLPPVTLPHTSPLVPLTTLPLVTTTTPRVTATTPNVTSKTPRVTATEPLVTTPTAEPLTIPVTRETLTVANLTISQCLCSSAQVAAQLSVLYQTTVLVVSCATDTSTTECTNYVCPCTGSRRRLLQIDVTKYTLVYKRVLDQVKPAAITKAIQTVIPTAAVTATQSEQLGATTLDWESVMTPDMTGGAVAGFLVLVAIAVIGTMVWKRVTAPKPPPPGKVIRETIKRR